MATRTAILFDDRGQPIGQTLVPEHTAIVKHDGRLFLRSSGDGRRLTGGGMGVVFNEVDPMVREKLSPPSLKGAGAYG